MNSVDEFLLAAIMSLWTLVLYFAVPTLLRRMGLYRPNFRGEVIPTAYGIYILLWLIPPMVYWAVTAADPRGAWANLIAVVGFGSLGFLDDIWGNRQNTGLKGHLRALVNDRIVTTGLIKAIGGIVLGLAAALASGASNAFEVLVAGAIIALSSNLINLLDLRPGRACSSFILLTIPLLVAAPRTSAGLALAMIPVLIVYVQDARARVMLGDAGSNLLGGILGLGVVLAVTSLPIRGAILAALIAVHVIAERTSISLIIERNPLLRRLDALTGIR